MLTLVYPYYDNGAMLERHLDEWSRYAPAVKAALRAIVVDDASPTDPALGHWRSPGFPVELYRIKQNIIWNVPGARNLGMHTAPEGFSLLTDIDHLLCGEDAARLVAALGSAAPHETGQFFVPSRRWADGRPLGPHTNSYVLTRALYWRVGGTDEDWSGWWGAGEHVFRATINSMATRVELENVYLTHFGRADIADASTTEWGRRDSKYHWGNNPALLAKVKRAPYRPDRPLRFDWEKIAAEAC